MNLRRRRPNRRRLAEIDLVSVDVDGVLASRTKTFANNGWISSQFDASDGLGVELLLIAGIQVVVLTSSRHGVAEARARFISGLDVIANRVDKGTALTDHLATVGIDPHRSLHIGDDLWDCLAFEVAGIGVAVHDAHPTARRAADWVTRAPGGGGAVREVADALLAARQVSTAQLLDRHRRT
jgi:3-deoxy-D-manno-octulosonate 8-phosphate phosphatase (KDO 8-P phosphatase)